MFVVPEARRRSYYRQQKILDIEGLEGESPAQVQELQKKLKALKKRVKQWLVVLPPPSRGPIVLGSLTVRYVSALPFYLCDIAMQTQKAHDLLASAAFLLSQRWSDAMECVI